MSAEILLLRPTSILSWERCGHAYYLQYVLGIRSIGLSHSLAFGKAVHKAVLPHVAAHADGESVDTVTLFQKAWKEELDNHIIQFSNKDAETLAHIGTELAASFPEAWEMTGLIAVKAFGKPLVENRMRWDIGDNVVLSGETDIVAVEKNDPEKGLIIDDLKLAAQRSYDDFAFYADQLTAYNVLLALKKESMGLGNYPIRNLGFLEGIKRKRTPTWEESQFSPARTKQEMGEYLGKARMTARLIRHGYFPRRSGYSFDSPCKMCDLRGLCRKGDAAGFSSPYGNVAQLAKLPVEVGLQVAAEHKKAA